MEMTDIAVPTKTHQLAIQKADPISNSWIKLRVWIKLMGFVRLSKSYPEFLGHFGGDSLAKPQICDLLVNPNFEARYGCSFFQNVPIHFPRGVTSNNMTMVCQIIHTIQCIYSSIII